MENIREQLLYLHNAESIRLLLIPVLHPEIISQYYLYLRIYTPCIYIRLQLQFYLTHFCVILKQPTGKLEGSQNVRRVILLLVHRKNKAAGI